MATLPWGTSFGLSNFTAERRIAILPLFNSLNLPYVEMKAEFFLDIGRTWDREDNFKQGTLFVDTGGGLKLGTPTHALNMIYGHSLREGGNLFILNLGKEMVGGSGSAFY
jgi:outer membrane protein assembly factor BamA